MVRGLTPTEALAYLGSLVGMVTVAQTLLHTLLPAPLRTLLAGLLDRLRDYFSLYHYVHIPDTDDALLANELYAAVQLHLSANARSFTPSASHVKLCRAAHSSELTWSPERSQSVPMRFQGARVWWEHRVSRRQESGSGHWRSPFPYAEGERRKYVLKVHRRDKERVVAPYMDRILQEASDAKHSSRKRRLYTNSSTPAHVAYSLSPWDHVPFTHPSTFHTLAMEPQQKARIQSDLRSFMAGREFYKKTGRAWKRGYLLHGPPGTGKSSLIAAMANFLCYDVYDLELTHVRSNGELRKLLLKTTAKSIIVIEDIDCSLHLTESRAKKPLPPPSRSSPQDGPQIAQGDEKDQALPSSLTLSGLLNFTDGLWSCCGEERIFIFTTNHIENLDPALLRAGRMDMHIFMSYCTSPSLKLLIRNYLDIECHQLLATIEGMINDAHITPAEVSEVLMHNRDNADQAMEELVAAFEVAKAKPWPPTPVKKSDTEETHDDAIQQAEVKEVVEIPKRDNYSETKKKCPYCSCGSTADQKKQIYHKGEDDKEKEEEDGDACHDKSELPQNNKKKENCKLSEAKQDADHGNDSMSDTCIVKNEITKESCVKTKKSN